MPRASPDPADRVNKARAGSQALEPVRRLFRLWALRKAREIRGVGRRQAPNIRCHSSSERGRNTKFVSFTCDSAADGSAEYWWPG